MLQDFVSKRHLPRLKGTNAKPGDGIFVLNDEEKAQVAITDEDAAKLKPYYTTQELGRYSSVSQNRLWIIYADREVRENIEKYRDKPFPADPVGIADMS